MSSESKVIHRRYSVFGQVQGVGFRYRAKHAADSLRLTGYVRNEYDGSVTLEVQGTEPEIGRLFMMVSAGRYVEIENMTWTDLPVDPNLRGFGYG